METPASGKLAFHHTKGVTFVNPADIVYCESDSNYCTLHFRDGGRLVVCKKLKEVESALPQGEFMRVHHSYLIRLSCVLNYQHQGSQLLLSNGKAVPVARRRKKEVMARFTTV